MDLALGPIKKVVGLAQSQAQAAGRRKSLAAVSALLDSSFLAQCAEGGNSSSSSSSSSGTGRVTRSSTASAGSSGAGAVPGSSLPGVGVGMSRKRRSLGVGSNTTAGNTNEGWVPVYIDV